MRRPINTLALLLDRATQTPNEIALEEQEHQQDGVDPAASAYQMRWKSTPFMGTAKQYLSVFALIWAQIWRNSLQVLGAAVLGSRSAGGRPPC